MSDRSHSLSIALTNLYNGFSKYAKPTRISTDGDDLTAGNAEMLRVPLQQCTAEAFRPYVWKAVTTWGGVADYLHFVPRILELCTLRGASWGLFEIDLDIVVGKLNDIEWTRLPAEDQHALREFFRAWWSRTLREYAHCRDAPAVLRVLSKVDGPEPYCEMLRAAVADSIGARRALAELILDCWQVYNNMLQSRPFTHGSVWWEGHSAAYHKVLSTVFGPACGRSLEQPFLDEQMEEQFADPSHTLRVLDHVGWYGTVRDAVLKYVQQ